MFSMTSSCAYLQPEKSSALPNVLRCTNDKNSFSVHDWLQLLPSENVTKVRMKKGNRHQWRSHFVPNTKRAVLKRDPIKRCI